MTRIFSAVAVTCCLALPVWAIQFGDTEPTAEQAAEDPSVRGLGRTLTGLSGRVIAGGRPVDFVVEVRLESETLGRVISSTATISGDGEFTFPPVIVEPYDNWWVVIEHEGYEEVRQHLDALSFYGSPQAARFSGLLILYLPPENAEGDEETAGGPASVDVRQLTAEIPEGAIREYNSAMEALDEGDHSLAIERLETAVGIAPDFYDALNKLGVEYMSAGRFADAEARLEHARTLNPNDPQPLVNLGALHFQEGQTLEAGGEAGQAATAYQEAIGVLEDAVRLDPLSARANFYLGSALNASGEWARAEPVLLQALEQDAGLQDARVPLAMAYVNQGLYPEALEQVNAYLDDAAAEAPYRPALENLKGQLEGLMEP